MKYVLYVCIGLGVFSGLSEHPATTKYHFHDKVLISAAWPFVLPAMITVNQITELEANPAIMKNK